MEKPHLLVVEDNDKDYKLLEFALLTSFRLSRTISLAETLEVLGREGDIYDCIVLDQILPDSSYENTFNRLRELPSLPPIVVLSSVEVESAVKDRLREGAQDYLVKSEFLGPNRRLLAMHIKHSILRFEFIKGLNDITERLDAFAPEHMDELKKTVSELRDLARKGKNE